MDPEDENQLRLRLDCAFTARKGSFDHNHRTALRVFNGFYEGDRNFVIDLYAKTIIIYYYGDDQKANIEGVTNIKYQVHKHFPWVDCIILKDRRSNRSIAKEGQVVYGDRPADEIQEHDICYSLDLLLNQDASFYLDTRKLRKWLIDNSKGWSVLNTFAYTGSLGIAALAGGASRVIQIDRIKKFLSIARRSGMLNHLDIGKMKLKTSDFFSAVSRLKREKASFDCVIADPPLFSKTRKGRIDLANQSVNVINKLRPLVKHKGRLIMINNALFLSGEAYMETINTICDGHYLTIEDIISIPEDITGYDQTVVDRPPEDPSPFNHPTKIILFQVQRK